MYAIIKTGGKQYKVAKGDHIDVELLEAKDGKIDFSEVLFLNNGSDAIVGAPFIPGCLVKGEFVEEIKGPKVIAFKFKRRKNYRRKVGHRQKYSRVKIVDIIKD